MSLHPLDRGYLRLRRACVAASATAALVGLLSLSWPCAAAGMAALGLAWRSRNPAGRWYW